MSIIRLSHFSMSSLSILPRLFEIWVHVFQLLTLDVYFRVELFADFLDVVHNPGDLGDVLLPLVDDLIHVFHLLELPHFKLDLFLLESWLLLVRHVGSVITSSRLHNPWVSDIFEFSLLQLHDPLRLILKFGWGFEELSFVILLHMSTLLTKLTPEYFLISSSHFMIAFDVSLIVLFLRLVTR